MDFFNKLTSSLASTNSYGGLITRVLSFTGSFNDRTSLLREHDDAELGGRPTQTEAATAPPPPPPAPPEAVAAPAAAPPDTATIAAGHSIDIEAAAQEEPEDPGSDQQDAESKRVGKTVQTVCLFAASASLVLFVNLPSRNKQQQQPGATPPPALLYSADMAFIVLGFFSSLGLSMFSIVARPGGEAAAVARAQKWGMVVAVASVVAAFTLRVCMVPAAGA